MCWQTIYMNINKKILICAQLDKVYDPNMPEDDLMERYEEMNRMREHVMSEVDKDQDKLISLEEFVESTKSGDWNTEEKWDVSRSQSQSTM